VRSLSINFAAPQPSVAQSAPRAGWLLLAAALLVLALLLSWYVALAQRVAQAEENIAQLRRPLASSVRLEGPKSAALAGEIRSVNRAIGRLSLPWFALFQDLEAAKDERIFIVSLQPSAARGEVRILAEADSFEAVADFLKALNARPGLRNARLLAHELRGQNSVQFEAQCEWLIAR